MSINEKALGEAPLTGLFIKLIIPTIAAQLATLTYSITDRIFIGHIPGSGALALTGVGLCMPVSLIISAFTQLIGGGGGARVSFYMGKSQNETARKMLATAFIFTLITGSIITAAFRIFSEPVLVLFGAGEEALPYALDYMNIYIFGTIFTGLASGLVYYITAQGKTFISMISVFLGAGLNVALDPLFIYIFDMGVKGAAFATVISQAAAAVFVVTYLMRKTTLINIRKNELRMDRQLLKESLSLGVSPFVMVLTESLVSIAFNHNLMRYDGTMSVAAYTIFATVMQMVTLPLTGIAQGAQPLTSYNYGAGNTKRVTGSLKRLFLASTIFSAGMWIFILIKPDFFVSVFSANEEIALRAASYMRIFFAMLWIMGPQFAGQYSYIALGNAKTSLLLALLRKLILLVPMIYLIPFLFMQNAASVFLAEPIADTIAASATVITFFLKYKKAFSKI